MDERGGVAGRWRALLGFAVLWLLYQSAEGIGERWLHSFAMQAALMTACVVLAWPLSRLLGYRGCAAYAMTDGSGFRRWLPGLLLAAVLAKFVALWIGLRTGIYAADPASAAATMRWLPMLPLMLLSTFVPSLAEDIITRGFWYRAAGWRWRSGLVFVLTSSTIYVLNHVYRLGNGPVEWLMLFCFGVVYAAALWRSGSLWAAVGLHWGWNLGNTLAEAMLPVDAVHADVARGLSIGMHGILLTIVLAIPRSKPGTVR